MTGARRTIDDRATLARKRATRNSGGALAPAAGPTARSCTTISSDHGWNSTAPSVTSRPSNAESRGGACQRTSGGTASHVTPHSTPSAATAQAARRIHLPLPIVLGLPAPLGNRARTVEYGGISGAGVSGCQADIRVAATSRPHRAAVRPLHLSELTQSGDMADTRPRSTMAIPSMGYTSGSAPPSFLPGCRISTARTHLRAVFFSAFDGVRPALAVTPKVGRDPPTGALAPDGTRAARVLQSAAATPSWRDLTVSRRSGSRCRQETPRLRSFPFGPASGRMLSAADHFVGNRKDQTPQGSPGCGKFSVRGRDS